MSEKIPVAVVSRTDTPVSLDDVCAACKHFVRMDPKAQTAVNMGGKALCIVCARELELQRPGTFTDENLALLPPMDTEYVRS